MAFGRAQLAVHLIVHPVLQVRRDGARPTAAIGANGAQATQPESWQLYEIDRLIDPQQIESCSATSNRLSPTCAPQSRT